MRAFETRVVRHSDSEVLRFEVEFIGPVGQSVTADCIFEGASQEPTRDQVIDEARRLIRAVADDQSPGDIATSASPLTGLSRPVDETEADTHGSGGRDWGTA